MSSTPNAAPAASAPPKQVAPKSQGKLVAWQQKLPEWMKELPWFRPAPVLDPNYQLVGEDDLKQVETLAGADAATRIRDDIKFAEYELVRLFRERDYEAARQQRRYRSYQIGFILLAVAATIAGGFQALALSSAPGWLPFWAAIETVIALFATYISSISSREPALPAWMDSRRKAEHLRREYFRFITNMPPYDELKGAKRQMTLSKRAADINRGVFPDEPIGN